MIEFNYIRLKWFVLEVVSLKPDENESHSFLLNGNGSDCLIN